MSVDRGYDFENDTRCVQYSFTSLSGRSSASWNQRRKVCMYVCTYVTSAQAPGTSSDIWSIESARVLTFYELVSCSGLTALELRMLFIFALEELVGSLCYYR